MSNFLDEAELGQLSTLLHALNEIDEKVNHLGLDIRVKVYNINGEVIGTIKTDDDGTIFFYPRVK